MTTALKDNFSQALSHAGRIASLKQTIPLVPEASTRRYYRLILADDSTLVSVAEDPSTAKTTIPLVQSVHSFLSQNGISVPEIYFSDPEAGVMLQQDLGDVSLNQMLRENPDQVEFYYKEAISRMFDWQRLPNDAKCPAFNLSFDVTKLMFEFEFFITHTLLGYYNAKVSDSDLKAIRMSFSEIAEILAAPKNKVFTHRDYHSRNIMVVASTALSHQKAAQYIIDFQDARLGLVQYDLCSLLCDAYAPITLEFRNSLLDFAFEAGKEIHRQTRDEFQYHFNFSAFQRIVKAMGTFGRQAALGREDYAACLAPARKMLGEVADNESRLRALAGCLRNFM